MDPIDVCAWFTRENFAAHKALDPKGLHATFDEWLHQAEGKLEELKRHGIVVRPVVIDPNELAAWCRSEGRKVDGAARAAFATVTAHNRSVN